MNKNTDKNKLTPGKIIAIIIALALFAPQLFAVLLVIGLIALPFYLALRSPNKKHGASPRKADTFDECPQPLFCFHKDKGEHHVRKGKEIDPWDRPDIDIRKYQHRQ